MFAQVAVVLWLLLLFRVLSSTAENFFSPILTQLSQEMGLPPRFAGGALSHSQASSHHYFQAVLFYGGSCNRV